MDGFDYKKIFRNREFRLKLINKLSFIPDSWYIRVVYWIKTGKKLNLKNPVGFNEKLNWLKLNDIHPEYTKLVDKLAVRDYISKEIGEEYLIPLLGHWEHFDDIDFTSLPDKFVLKCNHDSNSVSLITDKKSIDKKRLKEFYDGRLAINCYNLGRDYPYKKVKPCIIAEKFMENPNESGIKDYKFFCFNGNPRFMFVVAERFADKSETYYDMDFNRLDIVNGYTKTESSDIQPKNFEKMKQMAHFFSKDKKFVRIDFYEVGGQIYFGEFTFFPSGGFLLFEPPEWEKRLGDWIDLNV